MPVIVCSLLCFTLLSALGLYALLRWRLALLDGTRSDASLKYLEMQRAVLQLSEERKIETQARCNLVNQAEVYKHQTSSALDALNARLYGLEKLMRSLSMTDVELREEMSKIRCETRDLNSEISVACKTLHGAFENFQAQMKEHLTRIDGESSRLSTMISSVDAKYGRR